MPRFWQSRLQSLFSEDSHCPKGQNLTDINQKQTNEIKLNNRWLANCSLQKLTRQHTYLQILNHKQMFRLSDIQAKLLTVNTLIKIKKHEKWGTKGKKQKWASKKLWYFQKIRAPCSQIQPNADLKKNNTHICMHINMYAYIFMYIYLKRMHIYLKIFLLFPYSTCIRNPKSSKVDSEHVAGWS